MRRKGLTMDEVIQILQRQDKDLSEIKTALLGRKFPRVEGMIDKMDNVQKDLNTLMSDYNRKLILKEARAKRFERFKNTIVIAAKIIGVIASVGVTGWLFLIKFLGGLLSN
jgi:hypothetical protein